ncbi:PREDICTED: uncharacterized protein LOC109239724 [Nicotiana attenuata]|uniref:uncharacterized protein LOC109239724 n=1 Tax=Nicotiana attenuata TaxID=49451 RepID=UPI000905AF24|nr:PREDICTED: uncharacterized protein LOC109239724 [Nicotiana attenuata]
MDPNEHVTSYTCAIKGNDLEDNEIESVLLKKFGETLSIGEMIWYQKLPQNSIDSFAILTNDFVKAHAEAIKVETRKSDLFKVKQRDNEMLREFVSRFQMEQIDLPPIAYDWHVQAFTQGLNPRSSLASQELKQNLVEYPAVTWADVHNRTEDCRQLREEVARFFNNGHLREFLSDRAKNHFKNRDSKKLTEQEEPQHVINMIIGRVDVPQGPMMKRTKVSITREKCTRDYIPEGTISFSDEDAEGIVQPHNDALVISVLINKSRVKRVLIDPGSSANIIRSRVVEQLGLQDQIVQTVL